MLRLRKQYRYVRISHSDLYATIICSPYLEEANMSAPASKPRVVVLITNNERGMIPAGINSHCKFVFGAHSEYK